MTINKDTDSATLATYIQNLSDDLISLDSVISSYTTAVTTFETSINPAFAATSWNDEVYTKLIGRATTFKDTEVAAIDTSIVSGNLKKLRDTINLLITNLGILKTRRDSYDLFVKKSKRSYWNDTSAYDDAKANGYVSNLHEYINANGGFMSEIIIVVADHYSSKASSYM